MIFEILELYGLLVVCFAWGKPKQLSYTRRKLCGFVFGQGFDSPRLHHVFVIFVFIAKNFFNIRLYINLKYRWRILWLLYLPMVYCFVDLFIKKFNNINKIF